MNKRIDAHQHFGNTVLFAIDGLTKQCRKFKWIYLIDILPALPDGNWVCAIVKGLRSRSGFEVDIVWWNRQIKTVKINNMAHTVCKVRHNGKIIDLKLSKNSNKTLMPTNFK
jgi:hypothetical protein